MNGKDIQNDTINNNKLPVKQIISSSQWHTVSRSDVSKHFDEANLFSLAVLSTIVLIFNYFIQLKAKQLFSKRLTKINDATKGKRLSKDEEFFDSSSEVKIYSFFFL